ncbi:class I lanthipeptide [Chitinophaga solisilvae]|uniref:Uncharacterized protein n=1 Tax=Chitinophaga solisilvae TaxID=1233460 RepID=A0A433WKR7_9BACT|nr:class I lanthipeptide [Chitinophaga solisilvae]NSL90912.1 hypothetical protein [Chitinophaga solisilvae]
MKKKKMAIEKKLSFNKETIASLNNEVQSRMAGGLPPFTLNPRCVETRGESCNTFPYTQEVCVFC